METLMVATTVSGLSADIEREWMTQLTYESPLTEALAAVKKIKVSEVAGIYGLSQEAEREWLSAIGSRA